MIPIRITESQDQKGFPYEFLFDNENYIVVDREDGRMHCYVYWNVDLIVDVKEVGGRWFIENAIRLIEVEE
jgi:hypothetical protein